MSAGDGPGAATPADPLADGFLELSYDQAVPSTVAGEGELTATGLPAGIAVDATTHRLTGIPSVLGEANPIQFTLRRGGAVVAEAGPYRLRVRGDPLLREAWHLRNTGQNAFAVTGSLAGEDLHFGTLLHEGPTGKGVVVAVPDDSVETHHDELKANVVVGATYDYLNGTAPLYQGDPSPPTYEKTFSHGTAVSALATGARNNNVGSRGVAPEAQLVPSNYLRRQSIATLLHLLTEPRGHVMNQSWGFTISRLRTLNEDVEAGFRAAATVGRGGLGKVVVRSAGNSFRAFSPESFAPLRFRTLPATTDPYNNTPFVLPVAAANSRGSKATYSSIGSNLVVTAPGGEYGFDASSLFARYGNAWPVGTPLAWPALITADVAGCARGRAKTGIFPVDAVINAFDAGPTPHPENLQCSSIATFNGTSAAAPLVTGVAALLLETKPTLDWRAVKHILLSTARRIDPDRAPDQPLPWLVGNTVPDVPATFTWTIPEHLVPAWKPNAAGYWFHPWYGFGAVDVQAAVAQARDWSQTSSPWIEASSPVSTPNLAIPDNNRTGVVVPLDFTYGSTLAVEAVRIKFTLRSYAPGDIGIVLKSPQGTESVLLATYNNLASLPESATLQDATYSDVYLLSQQFYDENANGQWEVRFLDANAGPAFGDLEKRTPLVQKVQLEVFGHVR